MLTSAHNSKTKNNSRKNQKIDSDILIPLSKNIKFLEVTIQTIFKYISHRRNKI